MSNGDNTNFPGDPPSVAIYSVGEPYNPDQPIPYRPETGSGSSVTFTPVEPTQLDIFKKAYELAVQLAESQQRTIDAQERTISAQAQSIEILGRMINVDYEEEDEEDDDDE